MVLINKKEYSDELGIFKDVFNEEYFNLKIYPLVGVLEKEAGLLSDISEAYIEEGIKTNCVVYGNSNFADISFLNDNLLNFEQVITTTDEILFTNNHKTVLYYPTVSNEITDFVKNADFILSPVSSELSKLFKYEIKIEGSTKYLYFNDYPFFHRHFW